jgi:hypothetical protein
MDTENINPNTEKSENNEDNEFSKFLEQNDRLINNEDKIQILKINDRIKLLESEMNLLIKKIETAQVDCEPIIKKLEDIKKEGLEKEKIYLDLKKELDGMIIESEEDKNIRLKDKIDELEKMKIDIDKIKKEHEAIIIPEPISEPTNKSKYAMDRYNKEVAERNSIKNNKMRLSNLLNTRNLNYIDLESNLNDLRNKESPYDIAVNKCKIAHDEYYQLSDLYNVTNKDLVVIERVISKDKFNGKTIFEEINKLYDIRIGFLNKGIWCLSVDPITRKTIVTEYDKDGNKVIVFNDFGEELYNRNLAFKKLDELESNPPTYLYTVSDMMLEFERESLKTILTYEMSSYNNFNDSADPEYNRLTKDSIKKEILEIKQKIKDINKKIDSLPKHEWLEIDKNAIEIEKNKIISSMSKATLDIYLNEQKQKDEERKQIQIKNDNKIFKINNHGKSLFKNYLNSIGTLKNDPYLNNIAVNIMRKFDQ